MSGSEQNTQKGTTVFRRLQLILAINTIVILAIVGIVTWSYRAISHQFLLVEDLRQQNSTVTKFKELVRRTQIILMDVAEDDPLLLSQLLASGEELSSQFDAIENIALRNDIPYDLSLIQEYKPIFEDVRFGIIKFDEDFRGGRKQIAFQEVKELESHLKDIENRFVRDLYDRKSTQIEDAMAALTTYERYMGYIIAVIIVVGMTGSLWATGWINRSITRPLDKLTAATTAVAEGNMDVAIEKVSNDELGRLAQAYNQMRNAIRDRDHELRELNNSLQRKVEERTADLEKAKQAAERAAAHKSEFLANMSHEIRTPLTSILGYAELLMESGDFDDGRKEAREYLVTILRNGKHLLTLINDILDLAKMEAGKLSLNRQEIVIQNVISNVASMLRVRAQEKGLYFDAEFEGKIPEKVVLDGDRLQQALMNLVGNAVKFTRQGGVRIVTSYLNNWHDHSAIRVDVIDTGIGIPPERLKELCKPFVQVDSSTSREFGGTGLGLAITKKLINMMGGELSIISKINEGSMFSITVPVDATGEVKVIRDFNEALEDHDIDNKPSKAVDLHGASVLLAEDGPDNRRLISTLLRKAGADVITTENGRDALEAALGRPGGFDVIFMDIQMPVMDGYEATRRLRANGYNGPIIALTAHAQTTDRERCLRNGCSDYLAKPVRRVTLVDAVARCLSTPQTATAETNTESKPMPQEQPDSPPPDADDKPVKGCLRSEFAEDPDLAEILDEFVNGLDDQIHAMRDALEKADHEQLRRLAHQLKGAGGSYGYPCLSEEARELEMAAKVQDSDQSKTSLKKLADLVVQVIRGHQSTNSRRA